jgi:Arc/MetJ-type ribon-helix-helix transcriptional regulator
MPLNVRLDAKTQRALEALAKRRRQTRSDIVREAITRYATSDAAEASDDSPFSRWADVIGVVRLGARDPDRTTGEQFAEIVRDTHARRSR